nr:non-reducing end alpha-L-arabinofuranosidase family hydrolase [Streptomyces sporangiiformans]
MTARCCGWQCAVREGLTARERRPTFPSQAWERSSDGRGSCRAAGHLRYFRSWTSSSIAGTWTPLADSESNPSRCLHPSATGPYNTLPWRLGLLTQTNSSC